MKKHVLIPRVILLGLLLTMVPYLNCGKPMVASIDAQSQNVSLSSSDDSANDTDNPTDSSNPNSAATTPTTPGAVVTPNTPGVTLTIPPSEAWDPSATGKFLDIPASVTTTINIDPSMSATTIQNKLNSLTAGKLVLFAAGTYPALNLSDMVGTAAAPIFLRAEKGAKMVGWTAQYARAWSDTSDQFSGMPLAANQVGKCGNSSGILLQRSKFVVIEGFDLSGYMRGITVGASTSVTFNNNFSHDNCMDGIMSYRSNSSILTNNIIKRSGEHAIYISDYSDGNLVQGNYIEKTLVNGIHCNGAITGLIIKMNELHETGSFPKYEGGAAITLVGGTSEPIIENNSFINIHGQVITCQAPNSHILNNDFQSYSWSGILAFVQAINLEITGNNFAKASPVALQLAGSIISSAKTSGNTFVSGVIIAKDTNTNKTYTIAEWLALGGNHQ